MSTHTAQNAAQNAPVKSLRMGAIKAAIWENESDDRKFYNVTFSRTYRDEEGTYHDAYSFGRDDLLVVAKIADQAHSAIFQLLAEQKTP